MNSQEDIAYRDGNCNCWACETWHEDGGEGLSMFCWNAEPVVIARGPAWPTTDDEPVSP